MPAKLAFLIFLMSIIFCMGVKAESMTREKTDILKDYNEYVEKVLQDWHIPGAAIAIVKEDKVIYAKGFGLRNVNESLPVNKETLFPIASLTKAFTATAAGALVEEGHLQWDDPVIKHLPGFRLADNYATTHVTVKDLLIHSSGLPGHDAVWFKSGLSKDEIINRIPYLKLNHAPGRCWQYNNMLYIIAGKVIEELSGIKWDDCIREKILNPLNMQNTGFLLDELQQQKDFSLPYEYKNNKIKQIPFNDLENIGPAGCMYSNVLDMSDWLIFNINKGEFQGKQVLSPVTLYQIHFPAIVRPDPVVYKEFFYTFYAPGWGITSYRGYNIIVHEGEIDGFRTHASFMPDEKTGIVILTNRASEAAGPLAYNAYDRLLGLDPIDWSNRFLEDIKKAEDYYIKQKELSKEKRVPKTRPSHTLIEYTGKYTDPGYGILEVTLDGNILKGKYNKDTFAFRHYHYDVFEAYNPEDTEEPAMKTVFNMNKDGEIYSLSMPLVPQFGDDYIEFTKLPEESD
jgi:CubicO group peptidase (beta-lactamase class C family)